MYKLRRSCKQCYYGPSGKKGQGVSNALPCMHACCGPERARTMLGEIHLQLHRCANITKRGWTVAATRHASPPNLNATPQHHRWSAFTGTRLKAESTSAFHRVGDLPVRRLCSRIALQTSSSASCFSFSVAVTCPASNMKWRYLYRYHK